MGKIGTKRTRSFLRAKGPHNPPPKKKQVNSSTYVESKFSLNQEKKDLPKNPDAGIRELPPAVQTKMGYNSMSQKRMGLHQQKEERRFAQDRSDSTAIFMAGKGPGQFNNLSWKAAADSAKKANPNIDADKIKSSDIYKPTKFSPNIENSHGEVSKHLNIVNKRYGIGKKLPQDRALEAGGSRPMHQATTSQIDPLTGMPLQANAPQMGNFSGFNEIPMYDQSMNPGAITQKRNLDKYEAKVDGTAVTKPGMEFKYTAGNTANSPESEKNVKGADRLDRMAESGYYKKSYVDKRKKDADVTLTSTLNPAFKVKK